MESYCHVRNMQDLLPQFKGLVFPFGALVEHHPISAKDHSLKTPQIGSEIVTWNLP